MRVNTKTVIKNIEVTKEECQFLKDLWNIAEAICESNEFAGYESIRDTFLDIIEDLTDDYVLLNRGGVYEIKDYQI